MDVIYHRKVNSSELPNDAVAETFLFCIEVTNVGVHAKNLLNEITDTSWISNLESVAKMSYEDISQKTVAKLIKIFESVDNKVTKDFGEYLISMSSGHCLKEKHNHQILPLSEIWKPKLSQNEGFDFHTLSPTDKFAFGEAKYVSSGNSYGNAAEQTLRFSKDNKDKRDGVHLQYFGSPLAISNLMDNKRGFILAFSINSVEHVDILKNTLQNEDIKELSTGCDELYIIGVKS